jgi:cytochrome c551/c552
LWDKRQQEITPGLTSVVQESIAAALDEEKEATEAAGDEGGVSLSVDGAWQSRGSGRSYNSASGHATAIGPRTGKCLGYAVRSKACRTCHVAKRKNVPPKKHECVHNWSGSSKAMEPDMVIQILKETKEHGVKVKRIIGDEDSTTIARARREVDADLEKGSDMNHLKKILGNKLYDLRKLQKYKSLTPKTIKYFQKMYSYALRQNQGNPKALSDNLGSIVPHAFGDHGQCNDKWCRYSEKPEAYKYSSLPHGKPLTGDDLKKDLTNVFAVQIKQVDKLSFIGSTQANESLNMSVAGKASKRINHSESMSLKSRVEAAVAQKNIGYTYLADVSDFI